MEKLRSEFNILENKSRIAIDKSQREVTKLKLRLKQQSIFGSIIGSTFCYSLSKATQIPSAVDMVLQEVIIRV